MQMQTRSASFTAAITNIENSLANIGNTLGRVLEDGKISGTEYLDVLLASTNIQAVFSYGPQAAKDWVIMSDDDRNAVFTDLAGKLNIPETEVQARIETTLKEAANLYNLFNKVIKSLKNLYSTWKKQPAPAEVSSAAVSVKKANVQTPDVKED